MRRKRLTDLQVAALPIRPKAYFHADPEMGGHYIRITPGGARSFCAVARDPYGKQIWSTVGRSDLLRIDEARELARKAIRRINDGLPPKEVAPVLPDSYADVATNWLKREVEKKQPITRREIERVLQKYVLPAFGDRPFTSIKRSDVSRFLDKIEDRNGSRMADICLSYMKVIADWYSQRDDNFVSPFVKKMRRHQTKSRERILDDEEIKTMWAQASEAGSYGAFVKLCLLTAQRREIVRCMRWSALADNVWSIPTIERAKGTAGKLKLPQIAIEIIRAQPQIAGNDYVFAGSRCDGPMAIGRAVETRLGNMATENRWSLHDLRRTARSLLTRCRVDRDVAEAVLGHKLRGVEAVYNRHEFFDEKAHALAALANLIEEIINGSPDKVVPIRHAVR
jgi:Phage integrase central domain/Arm DNA-binding domain/Phage integrase family